MLLNLANKITVCRILSVPFFIIAVLYYSPEKDYYRYIALGIFFFAVISDALDGFVARRFNQKTRIGAILDPLADKLLLMSSFICLYKIGIEFPVIRFPIWLIVVVMSRDAILLMGALLMYLLSGRLSVKVTYWGKISTFFQMAIVLGMLLQWSPTMYLWYVAAFFTCVSGFDYIISGFRIITALPNQEEGEKR